MVAIAMMAGALAIQAAPAAAPAASAPCPAGAALPAPYAGWDAMQGVTAGSGIAAPATLAIGRSARATLVPVKTVRFPVALTRPAEAGATGGVFAFDVATPGAYRVALDSGAWVDVVAGGKALVSGTHGHGPECSGVRKFVEYRLVPGRYVLQVSGAKAATLTVMVAKVD